MNPDLPEDFLVREEPVPRLEKIVFALCQAARRRGENRDRVLAAMRSALSAQCPRCGTRVTGDELLVLAQLPAGPESGRITRLRSGLCARDKCPFRHYRLIFQRHPDLNWARLLASEEPADAEHEATAQDEAEPVAAAEPDASAARRRTFLRVGILLGLILLLYVVRQLYFGGRIPLFREPEKFRVDPAPGGEVKR